MKRFILFLVSLLVFSNSIFSQKISFSQRNLIQKKYYEVIDFEIVMKKIVIPVTINNKEYKFLLDTGAPNIISKTVFNDIQGNVEKNVFVSDANNINQEMTSTIVKSIKIKDLNFENTTALVSDLDNHPLLKCYKIDGFIGSNLLQNSIIKISLKDKKITLTDDIRKLKTSARPTKLKLIREQKSPFIELKFTGSNNTKGSEYALLDTGMDGFYDFSNRVKNIFEKENIVNQVATSKGISDLGLFGVEEAKEQQLMHIHKMTINSTTFENIITETTDDDKSRVGLELLEHGDIIIDFRNTKFYFESNEEIVFNKKAPIISYSYKNNKLIIGHVWSTDYKEKLAFEDEIIRLDNFTITEMESCDLLKINNIIKSKPSYEIEVLRKDNTTVIIQIENL